jgi:hypothetical protein
MAATHLTAVLTGLIVKAMRFLLFSIFGMGTTFGEVKAGRGDETRFSDPFP